VTCRPHPLAKARALAADAAEEAERILAEALADPKVSAKDKARYRRTLLVRIIARLEALAGRIPQPEGTPHD
jgi:hypothetical protein